MSRPNNRQNRAPRGNNRPRKQQYTPNLPTTQQVIPGAAVSIVLKEDQPTGNEVQGYVKDLLTRGNHPRGIKVRLQDGRVGRVQRMSSGSTVTSAIAAMSHVQNAAATSARPAQFASRDARLDGEFPEGPPPRSLADFLPPDSPIVGGDADQRVESSVATVKCPICGKFEGDEVAVSHHVEAECLS
ncbi:hypothetical protein MBLNU230_g2454t1 [Neophaeotheca triangularis]